jgi:hypothetical protein
VAVWDETKGDWKIFQSPVCLVAQGLRHLPFALDGIGIGLKPWWEYSLGVLIKAYRELEKSVGTISRVRGAKTAMIEQAIDRMPSTFGISDLERACPSTSRDMIRVVLNRLRDEGALVCKGTGRKAVWEKRGNKPHKHGNKSRTS